MTKSKTYDKQLRLLNIWLDQITVENNYQFSYEKLEELTGVPKGTIGRYGRDYKWQEARAEKLKLMMISVSSDAVVPLDDSTRANVVTLVQNQKLTYDGYSVLEAFVLKIGSQDNPSAKDVKLVMEIVKMTSDRDDRFTDAMLGAEKSFEDLLGDTIDIEVEE